MQPETTTVYVVDDEAEVREGVSRLLQSAGWTVQTYASAEDFLEHAPENSPGCMLLDVGMPGMSGTDMHEYMLAHGMPWPVIYLTGQSSVPDCVKAMKQGAVDFLEKPIDESELLPIVEKAVGRSVQARELTNHLDDVRTRLGNLSVREREVMSHVIVGRLNKQIASDLGIAIKTVKVHRGRVMAKMQVRSVAKLVMLCDDLGIRN